MARPRQGAGFVYPADYNSTQLVEGAFGIITGPKTSVRILFDKEVERFVRRRRWHPTQRIRRVDGGVELSMEVAGMIKLRSWILGFGDKAEVPLRDPAGRDRGGAGTAWAKYGRPSR